MIGLNKTKLELTLTICPLNSSLDQEENKTKPKAYLDNSVIATPALSTQ